VIAGLSAREMRAYADSLALFWAPFMVTRRTPLRAMRPKNRVHRSRIRQRGAAACGKSRAEKPYSGLTLRDSAVP